MVKNPVLTIVVPCYNEEEVFNESRTQLRDILSSLMKEKLISNQSKLLFVDDGSRDHTWELISEACQKEPYVTGLKLSRNFGHQKALLAGLSKAMPESDCLITIDADLQDDIQVIRQFILKFLDGYDVVYGVRQSRKTDTAFKKYTAMGFYRLMNRVGLKLVYNHADYRLMSQRAVQELLEFKEANLFLRGIVPLVGFKSTKVYYDRKLREAGVSKYPLHKMLAFAFDGMTSFSVVPIRIITSIGFMSAFLSILAAVYACFVKFSGQSEVGWTSLILSIWFLGGLLLMSIGLIGEYIGKIYEEVKNRPRFIIEEDLFSGKIRHQMKIVDGS